MKIDDLALGDSIYAIDNVRDVHDKTFSFSLSGDVIDSVSSDPPNPEKLSGQHIDGTGWMALPPMADVHAHIDKALTWNAAGRPQGSLEDAVKCWFRFGPTLTDEQIESRAEEALLKYIGAGVTALRSHANFGLAADPLADAKALVHLKHKYKDYIDLQVVPMSHEGMPPEYLRQAAQLDVDLLGGAPHLDDDPIASLDLIINTANDFGLGTDIHTDETLNPDMLTILDYAKRVKRWEPERIRSAGHCVSLSMQSPDSLSRILDVVHEAGISIITNPQTNLFLQGWDHPIATPRGIAPVYEIRKHGILVAAGGDNMQDPFNPFGRGDMLEMVSLLVVAGHVDPVDAYLTASVEGRKVMGLEPRNIEIEEKADFVLFKGSSLSEVIAFGGPNRVVVKNGRVIATTIQNSQVVSV
jgi:cytosine deaminase